MKLRPRCGCVVAILAAVNLVFTAAAIIALVRGTMGVLAGIALSIFFVANLAACVILAIGAFRGMSLGKAAVENDLVDTVKGEEGEEGEEADQQD